MKYNKFKGKKTKKPGHSKKQGKKKDKNMVAKKEIVVYAPRKTLMPFPPKYRTKFSCELIGSYAGGGIKQSGHFCIQLNSPYLPFNNYGSGTNTITVDGVSVIGANPITAMMPTGYTQLINANLYNSYKCHAAKIFLEFIPTSSADSCYISITPSQNQTDPIDYPIGVTQPLSVHAICYSGKVNEGDISKSQGALKNYQKVRTVLGLTKIQEEADTFLSAAGFNSSNVTSQLYWTVNWQTCNAAPLSEDMGVRVRLEYYVTCWNQTAAVLKEQ